MSHQGGRFRAALDVENIWPKVEFQSVPGESKVKTNPLLAFSSPPCGKHQDHDGVVIVKGVSSFYRGDKAGHF